MNKDPEDKEPVIVSIPLEQLLSKPIKLPKIPEIEPAPELYDPEFEEPVKPMARLLRLLKRVAALVVIIITILWTVSDDVIKEKLNPFISSFIDRIVSEYPLNDNNADHSHNNPIEVTGTVEASKNSKGVSAHNNDPDK